MHDRTFSGRFRLYVHDCSPMAFPKMAFAKLNERLTLARRSDRIMKAVTPDPAVSMGTVTNAFDKFQLYILKAAIC
jgi:hypothetical protein